jgi:hypothetical protein
MLMKTPVHWSLFVLMSLPVLAHSADPPVDAAAQVRKHRTALKDTYWPNQYRAAEALAKLGPAAAEAVPDLLAALKSREELVRTAAAEALGKIDPTAKGVVSALTGLLKDSKESVREAAAVALERAGEGATEAVPVLAAALDDKSTTVGAACARTLAEIGPAARGAEPALRRAMKSPHANVRAAAAQALEQITPLSPGAWPSLLTLRVGGHATYSPDGRRVAVCGSDSGGHSEYDGVWDAVTGKRISSLKGRDFFDAGMGLTFSPDGKLVAGSLRSSVVHAPHYRRRRGRVGRGYREASLSLPRPIARRRGL